jgi:hypothetical protein
MIIHTIRKLIDMYNDTKSRWENELFNNGICYCDQEKAYIFPDGYRETDIQEAWCRLHNLKEMKNLKT